MAKWAEYLISGIWYSETAENYISHVMLHVDYDITIGKGEKKSKEEVIKLIKNGAIIKTITWDYSSGSWISGAIVGYEKAEHEEHLCTYKGARGTDNIDNLINMITFPYL